jgi:hypothetical protein
MIIANGPHGVRLEQARLENARPELARPELARPELARPGNNSSARIKIA